MVYWRFVVRPKSDSADPLGSRTLELFCALGVGGVDRVGTGRIFLIGLPEELSVDRGTANRISLELLTDPVVEQCEITRPGELPTSATSPLTLEVHLHPGVMDNVAHSTTRALADMGIAAHGVRTARLYELSPPPDTDALRRIRGILGNDCIENVIVGPGPIGPPPEPQTYEFRLRHVPLAGLDDAGLAELSRRGHLFLSVEEMRAIQAHFGGLDRDPTDLELETLAQTWSEHCVHKTLRSAIEYHGAAMPGENAETPKSRNAETQARRAHVVLRYDNLLKDTVMRATEELTREGRGPECLSVFKDNAGVIAFDDQHGIAFKVETHNHPSAIEPYGGAATGVGGVIRDVLGCGLGAKPIANTDVFCVAPPDWPTDGVPKGIIHPQAVLRGVVAGVRDYGNRMGIPTVNGAVHFDPRYLGNPLVFCGCVGLIPRDRIDKAARPGDRLIVMGGRTGRDGIHGATFSSAELTDTHGDEFAHAVQIGNPIEEKKVLDVVLQARDFADGKGGRRCLFSAITDCGAGGLSSAIGEMAAHCGAEVDLEKVPLKYAGLRYDEIWISEAQERMVLAVPPECVEPLLALARGEDVEATVIGRCTDTGRLVTRYHDTVVGELDLRFLHEGLPRRTLRAEWPVVQSAERSVVQRSSWHGTQERAASHDREEASGSTPSSRIGPELQRRLASPTVASKHWIIRQYDHEVQGRTVVPPLVGPGHGPSDAAVIRPRLDRDRGIALGCGLAPALADLDPYWMAVAAIDEALRNVVCVGGDPARTAILDNFCWPRVDDAANLGALVRACQGCYDAAKAYGLPFISGKDSLNNEFTLAAQDVQRVDEILSDGFPAEARGRPSVGRTGRLAIPGTLLISAVSIVEDVKRCVTMDLKRCGSQLVLLGRPMRFANDGAPGVLRFDLKAAWKTHAAVARLIDAGLVQAVHDVSDGGLLVALAEMALAGHRSCRFSGGHSRESAQTDRWNEWVVSGDDLGFLSHPYPALYLVEAAALGTSSWEAFRRQIPRDVPWLGVGDVGESDPSIGNSRLSVHGVFAQGIIDTECNLSDLRAAWTETMNW